MLLTKATILAEVDRLGEGAVLALVLVVLVIGGGGGAGAGVGAGVGGGGCTCTAACSSHVDAIIGGSLIFY